jgi:hypothetical protein
MSDELRRAIHDLTLVRDYGLFSAAMGIEEATALLDYIAKLEAVAEAADTLAQKVAGEMEQGEYHSVSIMAEYADLLDALEAVVGKSENAPQSKD